MSCPTTIDEVVAWFVEAGTHEESELRELVGKMIAEPNPFGGGVVTPSRAWNWIVDFQLLYRDGRFGWVTPEGRMLSAA